MSVDATVLTTLHGPLERVPTSILNELAAMGTAMSFQDGEHVMAVNGASTSFHIVTSGLLRVGLSASGSGPMTLQTLRPGDLAGLSWMWPPRRWQWDVTAIDQTETVSFDVAEVMAQSASDAEFRSAIVDLVATELHDRLSHARLQLLDMYGVPTP